MRGQPGCTAHRIAAVSFSGPDRVKAERLSKLYGLEIDAGPCAKRGLYETQAKFHSAYSWSAVEFELQQGDVDRRGHDSAVTGKTAVAVKKVA